MSQLNLQMTPEFESNLRKYMKIRHIKTKAEALRSAIKEGLERSSFPTKVVDFSTWLGSALEVPPNKNVKFRSNDDLWK